MSGLRHSSAVGLVLFFEVDEFNLLVVGELVVELLFFFYHDVVFLLRESFWLVSGKWMRGNLVVV